MTEYYYSDGEEQFGPFTLQELQKQAITQNTYIWWSALPDWVRVMDIPELRDLLPDQSSATPKVSTTLRPKKPEKD
ncbi:MAG TPA: hypothetical protein DCS93_36235 [Microscillaceae bacterium]|nr:hypothetical protein [Microscillaceae bacterium]